MKLASDSIITTFVKKATTEIRWGFITFVGFSRAQFSDACFWSKKFVPFVMSSFGGLGPAAREFLTMAYRTARRSECFTLGVNHRALQTTWNTLTAATYWDARISVACSQADAEFQGLAWKMSPTL